MCACTRDQIGAVAAPRRHASCRAAGIAACLSVMACIAPAAGQTPPPPPAASSPAGPDQDARPYDDRLLRLAEILGAVHYLRELCGSNEGQAWRERMRELVEAEGSSALRRARLTRSFNSGYRSYSRTYNACSPSAQQAIGKFLAEGAQIAEALVKAVP